MLSSTENPSIHLLKVFAKASAELSQNKYFLTLPIWKKFCLFQNENELSKDMYVGLEQSIDAFIFQYLKSNQEIKEKPIFYLFFNP